MAARRRHRYYGLVPRSRHAADAQPPRCGLNASLYIAFVVAAALLILSPGPTVMLVTSTSLGSGRRAGLVAVAGSTLAAAIQLAIVVGGLASIVTFAGNYFELIRWAGVGYLIYLGLSTWRGAGGGDPSKPKAQPTSVGLHHFSRGFLVTLTNPKTLLFHGAFLPQFVDPALPELPQLVLLASTFVVVAGVGDSAWAILAARIGRALSSGRARRIVDRISASIMLGAAVALAAVRRAE